MVEQFCWGDLEYGEKISAKGKSIEVGKKRIEGIDMFMCQRFHSGSDDLELRNCVYKKDGDFVKVGKINELNTDVFTKIKRLKESEVLPQKEIAVYPPQKGNLLLINKRQSSPRGTKETREAQVYEA